jgi:hypothetical protein
MVISSPYKRTRRIRIFGDVVGEEIEMQLGTHLEGCAFVEALYESTVESCGNPIELRLFDPQFSEHLNEDWLCQATEKSGITSSEIRSMVNDGLLIKWPRPGGSANFTLYSEKQAEVIKRLLANPRYTKEEVAHTSLMSGTAF